MSKGRSQALCRQRRSSFYEFGTPMHRQEFCCAPAKQRTNNIRAVACQSVRVMLDQSSQHGVLTALDQMSGYS